MTIEEMTIQAEKTWDELYESKCKCLKEGKNSWLYDVVKTLVNGAFVEGAYWRDNIDKQEQTQPNYTNLNIYY